MAPNKNNFCGGNYQDWLEVMLTDECNGSCNWCIEKNGYHPTRHVTWIELYLAILRTHKLNVLLLGGEPTLYPNLQYLIYKINESGRRVYLTTNGSNLTPYYIRETLRNLKGINISIHSSHKTTNEKIMGISFNNIQAVVDEFHKFGITVRFNCNVFSGCTQYEEDIMNYIAWARQFGVDSVRFSELSDADGLFVDLAKVLAHKYGLTDDPWTGGCIHDTVIDGIPITFKQMCGFLTSHRAAPEEGSKFRKQVLYYDGNIYDGWQTITQGGKMSAEITRILKLVKSGTITIAEGEEKIQKLTLRDEKLHIDQTIHPENYFQTYQNPCLQPPRGC